MRGKEKSTYLWAIPRLIKLPLFLCFSLYSLFGAFAFLNLHCWHEGRQEIFFTVSCVSVGESFQKAGGKSRRWSRRTSFSGHKDKPEITFQWAGLRNEKKKKTHTQRDLLLMIKRTFSQWECRWQHKLKPLTDIFFPFPTPWSVYRKIFPEHTQKACNRVAHISSYFKVSLNLVVVQQALILYVRVQQWKRLLQNLNCTSFNIKHVRQFFNPAHQFTGTTYPLSFT